MQTKADWLKDNVDNDEFRPVGINHVMTLLNRECYLLKQTGYDPETTDYFRFKNRDEAISVDMLHKSTHEIYVYEDKKEIYLTTNDSHWYILVGEDSDYDKVLLMLEEKTIADKDGSYGYITER